MPARPQTGPALPTGIDELILPGSAPRNLRTHGAYRVEGITSDLYHVAERLRELNERLLIHLVVDKATGDHFYTIVEVVDGVEQTVFKCRDLDARVVEHVRYLLNVPMNKRFAEAERLTEKYEADQREADSDDLAERIGLPMARELAACGFLDEFGGRSTSYPSKSVATSGRRIR